MVVVSNCEVGKEEELKACLDKLLNGEYEGMLFKPLNKEIRR